MKNQNRLLLALLCITLYSCNKDNDCDGTIAIEAVVPNSNPPGTEIKIKGDGLSVDTEVRFAGQLAKSNFSVEKGLVATVPNNVIGLVDLTVEDGECLVRTEFEVLGALPVNWVATSTVIVIPILPATFPTSINNQWVNYYDKKHRINIQPVSFPCDTQQLQAGFFEEHDTNVFLNDNPVSGYYDCPNGKTLLIIDRTSKTGGMIDTLDGTLIAPQSVGEDSKSTKLFMILISRITGRQLIINTN